MKISVPFGGESFWIDLPDDRIAGIYHAGTGSGGHPERIMTDALAKPLDSPDIETFLEDVMDVAVIVNDATRPTPTSAMLAQLMPYLSNLTVKYIVATGTHRPPKDAELLEIF